MGESIIERESPDGWDELYRILSVHRRRCVLEHLWVDGESTVEELARRLAAVTTVGDGQRTADQFRLKLVHVDLPMLVTADLVDWTRESGRVSLTDVATEVPLFSALPDGLVGTPQRRTGATIDTPRPHRGVEGEGD